MLREGVDFQARPFEADNRSAIHGSVVDRLTEPPRAIRATPFVWRDPSSIPPREWLYGRHYARKFISTTLAPGGLGKSSLVLVEALAMITGRPLLGVPSAGSARVWIWNGEDPRDEIERRIAASCLHYGIQPHEIADRLFIDSGRETEIIVAHQARDRTAVAQPVVEALLATIRENGIDCVFIDPCVSSHEVSENDNNAIKRVAKTWARIADQTNCAVELVHHTRKIASGETITIADGRGAVALIDASRSARVLNPMSEQEAANLGVENRRLHFRVDNGKASMSAPPPTNKASWFKMASIDLRNGPSGAGDSVGVVANWTPPDLLEEFTLGDLDKVQCAIHGENCRDDSQANEWVGKLIAEVLNIDLEKPAGKAKVKALQRFWIASKALAVVERKDRKGNDRKYIEVGEWAREKSPTP